MDQMVDLHGDAFKDHKNWQSSAPAQSGQASKDDQYFVQPCWELELDTGKEEWLYRNGDLVQHILGIVKSSLPSRPPYHSHKRG